MKNAGIVTFHSAYNYGSVLQAYALSKILSNFGIQAKIIDFRHPMTTAVYDRRFWNKNKSIKLNIEDFIFYRLLKHGVAHDKLFLDFIEHSLPLTKKYYSYKEIKEHFDYLICGSDQIWNPLATGCNDLIYYLSFGDSDTVKFSYAASSGTRPFLDKSNEIISLLKTFRSIGVREDLMKQYLMETANLSSEVNPDPTLLVDSKQWENLEAKYAGLPEKYILLYSLSHVDESLKIARMIADDIQLPLVFINTNMRIGYYTNIPDFNLHDVGPCQFLWLFNHANFIVTNTFHGNMFSLIFRKNFVNLVFGNNDNRIHTLHEKIGLNKSRIIKSIDDLKKSNIAIDYSLYEDNIVSFINEGMNFIKNNLV